MQSFVDKFVEFSARLANQVHLRSLRDAFATVMPIFILAGLAVLVNNVVFPWTVSSKRTVRAGPIKAARRAEGRSRGAARASLERKKQSVARTTLPLPKRVSIMTGRPSSV